MVYFVEIKTPFSIVFYGVSPYLLYSEGKLYSSTSLYFSTFAFHIEVTPLADGTYELTQEPDGDFSSEVQANVVELTEAPNFGSEEPRKHLCWQAPEHNPIISNYATYRYYLLVHLSCWS